MLRVFLIIFFISLGTSPLWAQQQDSVITSPDTTVLISADTLAVVDTIATNTVVKDTLTIIGVGDIMMGTSYPIDKLPPDSGRFMLKNVADVLSNADVTMGNLEGVLLDSGGTPKSCRDPKVCYVFRSPTGYVRNLTDAGFDVMSIANNHAGDFGEEGRQSTMRTLDSAGMAYAGTLTQPYTTFTKDSIRYGFTAFAPNSGCVSLHDLAGAKAIIQHLDSISDVVIVSFHGGAEGAKHQHVPRQREIFYGEDRGDVYRLARLFIDAGADIVFGHGPHVTRAIDVYNDRFIAYSLGNFCTYKGINIAGVNGLAPIMKVHTSRTGVFYKAEIIPTYQTHESGVVVDPDKQVIKVIQSLTQKDFPESPVQIDDNGIITYLAR